MACAMVAPRAAVKNSVERVIMALVLSEQRVRRGDGPRSHEGTYGPSCVARLHWPLQEPLQPGTRRSQLHRMERASRVGGTSSRSTSLVLRSCAVGWIRTDVVRLWVPESASADRRVREPVQHAIVVPVPVPVPVPAPVPNPAASWAYVGPTRIAASVVF
ncbi:hypothetical protein GCM10010129_00220 [Streptomyces fumigatiscleroticus]|nr:hypothetical protein GCM10010129_00220 [Streptomyces fumigatiscleroticus]